jgi:hypothetical protein
MDMITTSKVFLQIDSQVEQGKAGEMSRLLSAALVDRRFCDLLLARPDLALADGYNGESFHLSFKARQFILTTKSNSLVDLADRWVRFDDNGKR